MKKKGFTLVELLVVIAIIALLMGILMPALARVRQIAFRMVCGTNLSGIGKAMLIYANDYDDELPRAGGPGGKWAASLIGGFGAANPIAAYGMSATTLTGGSATITSSFYLLVKYAEVTTKSFICKGDSGVSEFEPANNVDVVNLWDFGQNPMTHCSYSYHQPYCSSSGGLGFPLTTSSEPGMAVAADPSPWLDPEASSVRAFDNFKLTGGKEFTKLGNTITHQDEGQNVLFLDAHVDFETVSFCGINDDNIYTIATAADWKRGVQPGNGGYIPFSRQDNLLSMDKAGDKGRSCFTAETPVWVNGQMVEISKVVATDSISGLEEHSAGINPYYELTLESGNSLLIVHSHYFMTVSGEWKRVDELSAGMQLKSMNGSIAVKSVVKKAMPFLGGSYNLNINGAESYYVGQDGVVALDCNQKVWETLEAARQ